MSWAFCLVPIATDNYAVPSVVRREARVLSGVRLQDTDYKYGALYNWRLNCSLCELTENRQQIIKVRS